VTEERAEHEREHECEQRKATCPRLDPAADGLVVPPDEEAVEECERHKQAEADDRDPEDAGIWKVHL
jgi:hypothetical protein